MSPVPEPSVPPAPRFESLGSSDVAICTGESCSIPEVGGERERSEPAESERRAGRPSARTEGDE